MTKEIPTLILGIGNILWADEGFGVRAVEEFHKSYAVLDPADKVIDGGTLGMYLFDDICRCDKLLVFDCCDFHGKPGELRVLHDKEISIWTSTKLSPHQDGMNDLLAAAHLRLSAPNQIIVVGFQPVLLDDYGGSLSNEAKKQLGPAVEAAFKELKKFLLNFMQNDISIEKCYAVVLFIDENIEIEIPSGLLEVLPATKYGSLNDQYKDEIKICLLYTSPSPRD